MNNPGQSRAFPASRSGGTFSLRIESLAAGGLGLGHHQGRAVFVPFVVPGEQVRVRLHHESGKRLLAELVAVEQPSSWRRPPPCPVFGRCGGCSLQHIRDEHQLPLKQAILLDALRSIAGLEQPPQLQLIASPLPFGYRNRGQYPVATENRRLVSGFFARGSHRVVAVEKCLIHHPLVDRAVARVRAWAHHKQVSVYDEQAHRGWLRHITARVNRPADALLVTLVATHERQREVPDLLRRLRRELPELCGLACNLQPARTNVIFGRQTIGWWGAEKLPEDFLGLKLQLSPTSFFQVNHVVAERLFAGALDFVASAGGPLLDAFCGTGLGALLGARRGLKTVGIDSDAAAIASARQAARENGLEEAAFETGPVERVLPRLLAAGFRPRAAILDPPRAGCRPQVLEALAAGPLERLAYISCHPGTLARDLKTLQQKGFRLSALLALDMFPQSEHLETLACLER